jgi:hypothetical protein
MFWGKGNFAAAKEGAMLAATRLRPTRQDLKKWLIAAPRKSRDHVRLSGFSDNSLGGVS